jgi:hypothetical protein
MPHSVLFFSQARQKAEPGQFSIHQLFFGLSGSSFPRQSPARQWENNEGVPGLTDFSIQGLNYGVPGLTDFSIQGLNYGVPGLTDFSIQGLNYCTLFFFIICIKF